MTETAPVLRLSREQFLNLPWAATATELAHSEIEYGDTAVSIAYCAGHTNLSLEHEGRTYAVNFSWTANGDTADGALSALYEFDVGVSDEPRWEYDWTLALTDDDPEFPADPADLLYDLVEDFVDWEEDVKELLPAAPQPTDIDYDEDTYMETFTVQRDNDRDLRFSGELVAEASSHCQGDAGRWTELKLYRTKGGKFICQQIGRTQWDGERDRFSGTVCTTETEVVDFFGHGWLAKELYANAGIDADEEVD